MDEMYRLLKEIGDLSFATVDENGNPRNRTMMVAFIEDGKIFFTTSRKKEVYRQLQNNPHVALNGNTPAGISLSICGKIALSDHPDDMKKIYEAEPFLHDLYKDHLEDLVALYIEHGEARIFDFSIIPPRTENYTF